MGGYIVVVIADSLIQVSYGRKLHDLSALSNVVHDRQHSHKRGQSEHGFDSSRPTTAQRKGIEREGCALGFILAWLGRCFSSRLQQSLIGARAIIAV